MKKEHEKHNKIIATFVYSLILAIQLHLDLITAAT